MPDSGLSSMTHGENAGAPVATVNLPGASVVSDLYTDTLGDSPADTYEGLVRWDVAHIAEALR